MNTVTSAGGTTIAYDRFGSGPPVIMLVGGFLAWSGDLELARRRSRR